MTFTQFKDKILKDPRSKKLNFEADGRLHYVYRISKNNKYYYGSKSELPGLTKKTIGITYFTSSRLQDFRDDFKMNTEMYKIKIVREFDNIADKIIFESYIHAYFQVSTNNIFFNKMIQTPFNINAIGFKHTLDTIKLMSNSAIKANAKIRADVKKYEARSKKKAEAAIRAYKEISADPVRSEEYSKKHSVAAIKFQAEIKNDPIRRKKQLKNMSIASRKTQAEIRSDPIRSKRRSEKASESAFKAHEKLRKNPEKIKEIRKKKSKTVRQYDLDGNFIKEFFGQREAAEQLGYSNSSGICACVNGRLSHYKGFIWK